MQPTWILVSLAVGLAHADLWPGLPVTNMPPDLTVLDPASTWGAHVTIYPNAGTSRPRLYLDPSARLTS